MSPDLPLMLDLFINTYHGWPVIVVFGAIFWGVAYTGEELTARLFARWQLTRRLQEWPTPAPVTLMPRRLGRLARTLRARVRAGEWPLSPLATDVVLALLMSGIASLEPFVVIRVFALIAWAWLVLRVLARIQNRRHVRRRLYVTNQTRWRLSQLNEGR